MINLLKQLIELIRKVSNYAMKNKLFRYLYKAFLFISSLYIVKIYIMFWRYTRKIWSLLSAILLLFIADFNFSNIITAFSLIISSLPSHFSNVLQNLWIYLINKISNRSVPSIPPIPSPKNRIADIIDLNKDPNSIRGNENKVKIYKPHPNYSWDKDIFYHNEITPTTESFWDKYCLYFYGSILIIVCGGITYYYYGDDIRSFIAPYFTWWFKKIDDRDPNSDSGPTGGSISGNEQPSSFIEETTDSSVVSSTPSSQSASPETYFRDLSNPSTLYSTPHTPLLVDKSVQTKTSPNINSSVQTEGSSNIDSSVQTESSSNIDSSVQTDILTNIDSSVQSESSLKGDNILDDTTKNEILQLFRQISPEDLNLVDLEDTINPENTLVASEIPETSLVKNSPDVKKIVRFIDGHKERIFQVANEEFESKKKGYRFWLESKSADSQASDSDYSPSPISPLEGSPWRNVFSSFQGRFSNSDLFNRFSEIILEDQSPEEILKANTEFNQLDVEKFVVDWLEAKSKNISAIDFIKTKTSIIYPITKKLLLNVLENT